MQKILPKKELTNFLISLNKKYDVIAPINGGVTKFSKIKPENISDLYLEKITDVPFKQVLMPEGEILLEFKNGKSTELLGDINETIVFGLRKCDLNAIEVLDKVMFDPQYLNKRKKLTLIGLYCENPDEHCFCDSMELNDYYDLFFYPKGEEYIIDVKSKKGEKIVKNFPELKKELVIPRPKNLKVLKNKDIEKFYSDKLWEKDANRCLSCSACTVYCPTCNCFDIKDILDVNMKDGKRIRRQTSCQLKCFSQVAGEKYYRDSRLSRFKHFVYHKILYYKKQKGRFMCVGCGRCLRVCPKKIDWVETINKLGERK